MTYKRFPNVRFRLCLVILICISLSPVSGFAKAPVAAPLLIAQASPVTGTPIFDRLFSGDKTGLALERAKIDYLIDRIRQSPYTFIRNGESYRGGKAAMHLSWKFHRKGAGIKRAVDFIKKIASRSSSSGQPYMIKIQNGKMYPVSELLNNELQNLEKILKETQAQTVQPV